MNELTQRIENKIDRTTTGNLAVTGSGIAFENLGQLMEFSKIMSIAAVAVPKHLRDNPGACLAVCIQAAEWQMSPFAVANKSYSVNDRLAYEAQLVNAVILRRAPIQGRFKVEYSGTGDTRRCKVSAVTIDGETVDYTSPEIGKIPVKNSPLWKGDPDQQLFYFSSRSMCRRHFPDVILGVYTQDEIEDVRPARGRVVDDQPIFKAPALPENSPSASPENGEGISSGSNGAPIHRPVAAGLDSQEAASVSEPKPRRGRPPKAEAAPAKPADDFSLESEPVFPANATVEEQALFLLERDAISEGAFIAALHRFKLAPEGVESLAYVEEKALKLAMSDWQTIREDIAAVKGGAA